MASKVPVLIEPIASLIQVIREQRVILDADLARLYHALDSSANQHTGADLECAGRVLSAGRRQRFGRRDTRDNGKAVSTLRSATALQKPSRSLRSRSQIVTLKRGANLKELHQLTHPRTPRRRLIGFQVKERRAAYSAQRKS